MGVRGPIPNAFIVVAVVVVAGVIVVVVVFVNVAVRVGVQRLLAVAEVVHGWPSGWLNRWLSGWVPGWRDGTVIRGGSDCRRLLHRAVSAARSSSCNITIAGDDGGAESCVLS